MRLRRAQHRQLARVAGADQCLLPLALGQAKPLLRRKVRDVVVAAVRVDSEDVAAIAAQCQQPIRLRCERVDNLVLIAPQLARRLALAQRVDLRPLRHGCARVRRLHRSGLHHRDRDRGHSLQRQRRQGIVALVAGAGRVNGSVLVHSDRGNLTPWRFKQNVAFSLRVDAVHQSAAVRPRNQVALAVPRQRPDVRLVAPEELLGLCAGPAHVQPIHRARRSRRNVEPALRIRSQRPDVMRLAIGCLALQRRAIHLARLRNLSRIEDHRGVRLIQLHRRRCVQLVHLAARQCGHIQRPIRAESDRLHAHILRLKQREGLAARIHAQHRRWRPCAQKCGPCGPVGGNGPDECGRRSQRLAQSGPLPQLAVAADGHSLRRSLFEVVKARLRPQMGLLRRDRYSCAGQREREHRKSCG